MLHIYAQPTQTAESHGRPFYLSQSPPARASVRLANGTIETRAICGWGHCARAVVCVCVCAFNRRLLHSQWLHHTFPFPILHKHTHTHTHIHSLTITLTHSQITLIHRLQHELRKINASLQEEFGVSWSYVSNHFFPALSILLFLSYHHGLSWSSDL